MRVYAPIDSLHGPHHNLLHKGVQRVLFEHLRAGSFSAVWIGLMCEFWSNARRGVVNIAKAEARELRGVGLALFAYAFFLEAVHLGIPIALENPWLSGLWRFGPYKHLLTLPGVKLTQIALCSHGAPSQKLVGILTFKVDLESLSTARMPCTHTRHVQPIIGSRLAKLSAAYPEEFGERVAARFAEAVPGCGFRDGADEEGNATVSQLTSRLHAACKARGVGRSDVDAGGSDFACDALRAIDRFGIEFPRKGRGIFFKQSAATSDSPPLFDDGGPWHHGSRKAGEPPAGTSATPEGSRPGFSEEGHLPAADAQDVPDRALEVQGVGQTGFRHMRRLSEEHSQSHRLRR